MVFPLRVRLNLKLKLLLSYVLILFLPLGAYTYVADATSSATLRKQTIISADMVFDETSATIDNDLQNLVDTLDRITLNQSFNRILSHGAYRTVAEQLVDYQSVTDLVQNLERGRTGMRVRVYFRNYFENTADDVNTFVVQDVKNADWYRRLLDAHSSEVWFVSNDGNYLSVGRLIYNRSDLRDLVGAVEVDLPVAIVHSVLEKSLIDRTGSVYVVGAKGGVIVTAGAERPAGFNARVAGSSATVSPEEGRSGRWLQVTYDRQEYMLHRRAIDASPWELVSIVPMTRVLSNLTQLRNQLLLLLGLIAIVGVLLALYVTDLNTRRIVMLAANMREIRSGNFDVRIKTRGADEIADLIRSFNSMAERIKDLVAKQFESGKALKNAELRTLQSQINPHFLYNSLDVINVMSIEAGAKDITRMVRAMTRFYRLGLNKGRDVVPVRDEIEHVEAYVEIQNIRHDEGVRLLVDVPESIRTCGIVRTTLQPIVENAVLHGILELPGGTGTVRIAGEELDTHILLSVSDDGVGMTTERLATIFVERTGADAVSSDFQGGFGLRNVHDRLRLTFGERYGLSVDSRPGAGTVVRITLPRITC